MSTGTTVRSINGIDLNVLAETVGAIQDDPELGQCKFRVRNKWIEGNQNCSVVSDYYGACKENTHKQAYEVHADEPPLLAGKDSAANPAENLLAALAGCATTSMVAHAAVRGIQIDEVESEIEGDLDLRGFLGLDPKTPKGFTNIRVKFKVKADETSPRKLKALAELSPVFDTLTNGVQVDIQVEPK
jgi:uncharacterized OsmC-like protein